MTFWEGALVLVSTIVVRDIIDRLSDGLVRIRERVQR